MEYLELAMNRRQFLSSVASLGVSAALPAKAVPIQPIYETSPALTASEVAKRWADCVSRMITQTEEYQRAECDLIVYGQSMFNPAKVLAEIEALDSRREPCDAEFAGRDQIG